MKTLLALILFVAVGFVANGQIVRGCCLTRDTNDLYFFECNGVRLTQSVYQSHSNYYNKRMLVKRDNKYGYLNRSGVEVIPCIYDNATDFSDHVAVVFYNCKTAILDTVGNLTYLANEYYFVNKFYNNYAIVTVNNRYGLINKKGLEVIKPKYGYLKSFINGVAIYQDTLTRLYGTVDTLGNIIMPAEYSSIEFDGRYYTVTKQVGRKLLKGAANSSGQLIIPAKYNFIEHGGADEWDVANVDTSAFVIIASIGTQKIVGSLSYLPNYRYIIKQSDLYSNTGKLLYSQKGSMIDRLGVKTATVTTATGITVLNSNGEQMHYNNFNAAHAYYMQKGYLGLYNYHNKREAVIDKMGHLVTDTTYSEISFRGDSVYCFKNDSTIILDRNFKPVNTVPYFIMDKEFVNVNGKLQSYFIMSKNDLYGVLDSDFSTVIPPLYHSIHYFNGLFYVRREGKVGLLDRKFREVIPLLYDKVDFDKGADGYFIVNNKKMGFVSAEGTMVFDTKYDYVFADIGFDKQGNWQRSFRIVNNGKTALTDSLGKILIDFKYDNLTGFGNWVMARNKNKVAFLNSAYTQVTPFEYDWMGQYSYAGEYSDKPYMIVKKGNKYGVIDTLGQPIFNVEYNNIYRVQNHNFIMVKNHKYGVYTIDKQEVVPLKYDYLNKHYDHYIPILKGKYGLLSSNGKELLPCIYTKVKDLGWHTFLLESKTGRKRKYGMANAEGKIFIPVEYDKYQISNSSGTIILTVGDKRYFYNAEGEPTNDCYIDKKLDR